MKTITEKLEDKQKAVWLKETKECREIVREIISYGVSQSQIKMIIKLLSLELEDTVAMKAIAEILTENINEQPKTVSILKPGGKSDE